MIINLNPDWRIRSEPRNWILEQRHDRKRKDTGEEYEQWAVIGYWGTLDGALSACMERRLKFIDGEYPPEAMTALYTALDGMRADIRMALKQYEAAA